MEQSESTGGIDAPLFPANTSFTGQEDREGLAQNETDAVPPVMTTGRFQCTVCQQTFSRIEHLTRHSRSHAKERSLKCTHCRKGFYRIDALRRHEQIHNEPKRSSLAKGARACTACAQARRRCTGERPCLGCKKRSLECIYLRSNAGQTPGLTITSASNFQGMTPSRRDSTLHFDSQPAASPNETHMILSDASNSPQAIQTNGSINSFLGNDRVHNTGNNQKQPSQSFSAFPQDYSIPQNPLVGLNTISNRQNTIQPLIHEEQASPAAVSNAANVVRGNGISQGPDTIPDSNMWYQSSLSALNWLPDDYIPGYNSEPDSALRLFDQSSPMGLHQTNQTHQPRSGSIAGSLEAHFPNIASNVQNHQGLQSVATAQTSPSFGSAVDSSSPDSQNVTVTSGRFYVDGDGARLPHVGNRRPKRHSRTADSVTPISLSTFEVQDTFGFPDMEVDFDEELQSPQDGINHPSQEVYAKILHWFAQTCLETRLHPTFRSTAFPSLKILSYFVQCYMQEFQPILPFIHPATFNVKEANWLLVLAMAAIGSHYADHDDIDSYVLAMHEFLRRTISNLEVTDEKSKFDSITFAQVQILSCVGSMYCGDEKLLKLAKNSHHRLVEYCAEEWTNNSSDQETMEMTSNPLQEWMTWYEAESRRRTGYSIWLLDTMWAFHFQMRPLLSLQDAKLPVPCQEVLWEAQTAREWQQLYSCSSPSPSLHSAIQLVYVEKRLQPSMGEFSRILLIHALFRRTWEVENYYQQPLTHWNPTAERQNIKSLDSLNPVWLPGIPTYSKWRNSACDCLDILHWHANSVIGAASGMEHTTVLHLHVARVILLTPYRRIINFALYMISEPSSGTEADIIRDRQHIQRWANEDQYKARLAMIHAGVLFWHVRRYSADGFYEPSSVFIATLALWAYGLFAEHTSAAANEREATPSDLDAEPFPTSMQLDRPADDELVQLFVRRGASMRANIMGVGNLCSEKGPERVLLEGRRLLVGLKSWGYSRRAVNILTVLHSKRSEFSHVS